MNSFLIFLSILTGVCGLVAARYLMPWSKQQQKWIWIGAFAPLVVLELFHVNHPVVSTVIYPLFAGVVLAEFFRPSFEKLKARWVERMGKDPVSDDRKTPKSKTKSRKQPK